MTDVRAGQTWYGWNHGSVWMVFDGDHGLFDLWCMDPRGAPSWEFGSIVVGRTVQQIIEFFDPTPPAVRVDTTALTSWTDTVPTKETKPTCWPSST